MNEFARSSLIERLELDRDVLVRVAHRTHQWGQAIAGLIEPEEKTERAAGRRPLPPPETLHSEAASLFAIAGSYRMLLDHDLARQSMLPATLHFGASGSTFAYPLAICAGEPEVALESLRDLPPALTAQDRANALLALAWIDVTGDRWSQDAAYVSRDLFHLHLDQARPAAEAAVGRMRVPLGALAHVLGAAERVAHGEGDPARLSSTLHDALTRMHDVTAAAMADRYHWQRLMSSVLPVEPEAAVLASVAMAAAMRAGATEELLERIELPPLAHVPLMVGEEIAERAL